MIKRAAAVTLCIVMLISQAVYGAELSLTSCPQGKSIEFSWGAVNGAVKYEIYRDNSKIGESAGTSYVDSSVKYGKIYSYKITATDNAGNILAQKSVQEDSAIKNPDTTGWLEYEYPDYRLIENSPLDASYLLDKPSGKHGFIIPQAKDINNINNYSFYFEDGTEARFFGINAPSQYAFPEYENAKEYARRIAQSGFNLVRFHLIDQRLYLSRKDNGDRLFDEQMLDKLFYFAAQLKNQGIYYMIDLSGGKEVTDDDTSLHDKEKIPNSHKIYGYFDEDMQQSRRRFEKQLLTTVNPYTGLAFKDDPSLALMALKNEDVLAGTDGYEQSPYYYAELKLLFNNWLKVKYHTREQLRTAWEAPDASNGQYGLQPDESQLDNTVEITGFTKRETDPTNTQNYYTNVRKFDCNIFLSELQTKCYEEEIEFLREMGVKCAITGGTCWSDIGAEKSSVYSNSFTDYVDYHMYNKGVTNANSLQAGTTLTSRQSSLFDEQDFGIVGRSLTRGVYGMPQVISEWNSIEPNAYNSEAMLMMSAFGAFQGWHPIMFAWEQMEFSQTDIVCNEAFNLWQHPDMSGAVPAASRLFLDGGIARATEGYYDTDYGVYGPSYNNIRDYYKDQYISSKRFFHYGLVGKSGIAFEKLFNPAYNNLNIKALADSCKNNKTPFVSVTNQLTTDLENRFFKLNTPYASAFTGFIGERTMETDNFRCWLNNPYATVYLTSLTDSNLSESASMLLTTVGRIWNSGQRLSADGRRVETGGTAPILMEPVTGGYVVKGSGNIKVYSLNSSGQRVSEIETQRVADGVKFTIVSGNAAMHYEIERIN